MTRFFRRKWLKPLIWGIIVPLGVIASIGIGGIIFVDHFSKIHNLRADFICLSDSLKLYRRNVGRLPVSLDELVNPPVASDPAAPRWIKCLDQPPLDPWGHPYRYSLSVLAPDGFVIFSTGPDGVADPPGRPSDDIHPIDLAD